MDLAPCQGVLVARVVRGPPGAEKGRDVCVGRTRRAIHVLPGTDKKRIQTAPCEMAEDGVEYDGWKCPKHVERLALKGHCAPASRLS